jgi:arylsulfatase
VSFQGPDFGIAASVPAFVLLPAQTIVGRHLSSFQAFPPRQRPGSFSVGQAMEMLMRRTSN